MTLDFSRCRLPPFQHQREDVAWLIERPYAFITSEMRTGKSKIVVDATQFMYEAELINTVIVVAPAPVRDVWADDQLGEIRKHAWTDVPNKVIEYHARTRTWSNGVSPDYLTWYVTNFEFIRSKARLAQLMAACGPKTLLVLDESSFVKNHAAQQTKACVQLRKACGRVVLLNGTPIFHSPMDLFSQGNLLHPSILACPYITHYKARYAVETPIISTGGKALTNQYGAVIKKIAGWTEEGLTDLQRRFAPITVRRLQAECLDLPPKLESVVLTATMLPAEWKAYKEMRDEMVSWLTDGRVAVAGTAALKAMRLSQITSGFLGGIEEAGFDAEPAQLEDGFIDSLDLGLRDGDTIDLPGSFLDGLQLKPEGVEALKEQSASFEQVREASRDEYARSWQECGRAKLDVLLWFIEQQLAKDPNLHVVVWCRYRAEVFRTLAEVEARFPQFETATIMGGQKRDERLRALALLKPETTPPGPVFAIGIEGTGSFGLDMTASHTCVTLSSGYSPGRSAQTLDRVYGPGQKHPIAYYEIVAAGPSGQKTIDHAIVAARRAGQDVATWTSDAWVKVLRAE